MNCKIIGFENGPLAVDCSKVEFYHDDKKIEAKNPTYLCRCGESKNKPFCDGSHVKADFKSETEIKNEVLQEYKGKDITINFNRSICAGSGECVKGLKTVFKSGDSKNWIHPDEDSNENIIKIISACPSGALSYTLEKKTHTDKRDKSKISVVKNGPYSVESVSLEGFQIPTNFSTSKYTLCRCGHSKNKPYCDYSHALVKWSDE